MITNNFLSLLLSAAATGADNATNAANELKDVPIEQELMKYVSFLPIIAIAVGFWFFLIRPQKKQEKEIQKMRNSLEVGDQITTIGGITGIVRQIKDEDTYIIETGADKSKIAIKKWAVQSKDTVSDK